MTKTAPHLAIVVGMLMSSGPAHADWPDTTAARLAVLAELQTLNVELLSNASATLTLDRWCARHGLAPDAKVVADRIKGQDKGPSADVRAQLRVSEDEPVAYRRVRLRCGDHVLSEADNWYVPSRLTAEMNGTLRTTDTAFGRVVQPLRFQRRTLSARLLWSPLPADWDAPTNTLGTPGGHGSIAIPDKVIEHQAVLTAADGTPFSFVAETYTGAVLAFKPPGGLSARSGTSKAARSTP